MLLQTNTYNAAKSIEATISKMLLLEKESVENYFFRNWVINTFDRNKFHRQIYQDVHAYVVKNFTYRDESEVEIITSPKQMLIEAVGDCDDFSLFIKAVLAVFGIKTFYMLAGKKNEDYSHVLVMTQEGILIDGTNDKFNFLDKRVYTHTAIVREN